MALTPFKEQTKTKVVKNKDGTFTHTITSELVLEGDATVIQERIDSLKGAESDLLERLDTIVTEIDKLENALGEV